ncbi:metal ABC transporter ATP-binding protein [Aetokthonos hydrillicola Thurmond2011]|uniref:Metal ABC transporter ATP-binding protein n=1 Tax=Aetokthonos hydrillicola Thurmond2011 TaxID=2712845 RepID=A0AAP5M629_9CYAN|nr:metal ABC transporter ATP-binding protein [Aetokthonos hydrillicola]MBO3457424.1 metal ABC transporter ATP-binding protein [Aetokthonos hydrillicola CCALA 1050]MBW4586054.1 metal ABC transporter ATP-binding protein [Aetokthonos hydrillicola CCALA 1050]MDR9893720.1 metal ABC transporter ATP-binding protein [Aetokthonos hydrillicola Thurmond2011]
MLQVQQLAVDYRGVRGIDKVSFRIEPGQLVGIVGPNGAGKTTLLKAMLGLIPKISGSVEYCTYSLHQQLEKVAYVPQRSQIDWDFPITVWNVVMMAQTRSLGWFRSPGQAVQKIVKAALERVEIQHLQHRRIGELSGGQQQRVFLARALAQQAQLFLLDEPFSGVDVKTEKIILGIFDELRSQGKILLVSNHDWGQALTRLDRLLLLNQQLIADGSPQQVMTKENLQRAYGTSLRNPVTTPHTSPPG